ncbi:MAG: SDR family oxidoreductase [Patescibacteria group bacterium]
MKIPLLGTGLSGLVGTRIIELLSDTFEFQDLSYETGVDITDSVAIESHFRNSKALWVLHLAAKADVDGCEKDRPFGNEGAAWKINVQGTKNIVVAAHKYDKRVLYISTDFVFDGRLDVYTENDKPNPLNWYGETKYEGEKLILTNHQNLVVRIAYPYRAQNPVKKDWLHAIAAKLSQNQEVAVLSDHVFTPTLIDDIAVAVKYLIEHNLSGIYHAVGSSSLTPFAAALEIAKHLGYNKNLVKSTNIENFYKNRATRPYTLRLRNDKISALGVHLRSFTDGLIEIKKQQSL